MKAHVAILAVAAVACGFNGIAVACGPDEDTGREWNVTAQKADDGEFQADMVPLPVAIKVDSDGYRYPPALIATPLRVGMEAALTAWIGLL